MSPRVSLLFSVLLAFSMASCSVPFMQPAESTAAYMTEPPAGKALVHFHRPSNFAGGASMPIFDRFELIGNLKGNCRFLYACDPGEHVFLGSGSKPSVIQANLQAGKVYDIVADVGMGHWKSSRTLHPITKNDRRRTKVADWEARERLLVLVRDERAERHERKRRKWAENVMRDFLEGDKQDRVKRLEPDDHR